MKKVNFKKYYDHITTDTYHDVPDEVFDILEEYRKAEQAYHSKINYHKSYYSLDRDDGLDDFHFHQLRHTYTSKLLANGAAPKDIQELLGHSDINTTMNIYTHATRESKRNSVMLLEVATA